MAEGPMPPLDCHKILHYDYPPASALRGLPKEAGVCEMGIPGTWEKFPGG